MCDNANSVGKDNLREEILAVLRLRKVKLWLPPYYYGGNIVDTQPPTQCPDPSPLQRLADELAASNMNGTMPEILASLVALQNHALEKLKQKRKSLSTSATPRIEFLQIKLLGLRIVPEIASIPFWTERVEVTATDKVLTLHRVDPSVTCAKFMEDLIAALHVDSLRIIFRGKTISRDNKARIGDILKPKGNSATLGELSRSQKSSTAGMMGIVSYDKKDDGKTHPDRTLISSIRHAAAKLGGVNAGGSTFEVTDQRGQHVSMLPSERLAFLTALGLHRLGRKRMETDISSSLVFLLEADQEWDQVNPNWREKVDNYGLLQLDIAWAYMKLESLDNLPDVTRRLELAETTLRKQVHSNFVTLALVQADMGNAVPPLSSVFCRLFLLQGVAYRYSHDKEKSKDRLDWAFGLCQSLRHVASDEQIKAVCDATGATQFQAISALRRTNGSADQAATVLAQDKADEVRQKLRRERQRKFGLCENTVDHVDLDRIGQLQSILGFTPTIAQQDEDGDDEVAYAMVDSNFLVAVGLLRLANNSLENAIDIYQGTQLDPDAVLRLVSKLDKRLEERGFAVREKAKKETEVKVDEVSLTMLISMGVEESMAKKALQHTENNTEMALLWLSNPEGHGDKDKDSTCASSGKDSQESDSSSESQKKRARLECTEAEELLEKELGEALRERDMEEEYFGSTLDDEWDFILQFREA